MNIGKRLAGGIGIPNSERGGGERDERCSVAQLTNLHVKINYIQYLPHTSVCVDSGNSGGIGGELGVGDGG